MGWGLGRGLGTSSEFFRVLLSRNGILMHLFMHSACNSRILSSQTEQICLVFQPWGMGEGGMEGWGKPVPLHPLWLCLYWQPCSRWKMLPLESMLKSIRSQIYLEQSRRSIVCHFIGWHIVLRPFVRRQWLSPSVKRSCRPAGRAIPKSTYVSVTRGFRGETGRQYAACETETAAADRQ